MQSRAIGMNTTFSEVNHVLINLNVMVNPIKYSNDKNNCNN